MKQPVSLVTGACGFIGSHMVEVLVEAGHDVRATDLPEAVASDDMDRGCFPSVSRSREVELVAADLRAPATIEPLLDGVELVFHCAHAAGAARSVSMLRAVNFQGTRSLLELLREPARRERLERFVLVSSGSVYGRPRPFDLPLTELTPPVPHTAVQRSRWEQEWLVMETGRRGELPFTLLRPFGAYGPRGGGVVGRMLMALAQRGTVALPESFRFRRPFVHVEDVARAALHLAEHGEARGEVFNIADDSRISMVELAAAVTELRGSRLLRLPRLPMAMSRHLYRWAAGSAGLVSRWLPQRRAALDIFAGGSFENDVEVDNTKLKRTSFELRHPDSLAGIAETIAWYQEEGWIRRSASANETD